MKTLTNCCRYMLTQTSWACIFGLGLLALMIKMNSLPFIPSWKIVGICALFFMIVWGLTLFFLDRPVGRTLTQEDECDESKNHAIWPVGLLTLILAITLSAYYPPSPAKIATPLSRVESVEAAK